MLREGKEATRAKQKEVDLHKWLLLQQRSSLNAFSYYRNCNSKITSMVCCTSGPVGGVCGAKLSSPFQIKKWFSSVVPAFLGVCGRLLIALNILCHDRQKEKYFRDLQTGKGQQSAYGHLPLVLKTSVISYSAARHYNKASCSGFGIFS